MAQIESAQKPHGASALKDSTKLRAHQPGDDTGLLAGESENQKTEEATKYDDDAVKVKLSAPLPKAPIANI